MTDAATPETATASEVHDLASAARAIEKIIRRDGSAETESVDEQRPNASGPDEHDHEADAETDDDIEHDPGVIDEDDEEEERNGEQEPRYTVKVGGEEAEVTLKDLIKGYQRGADYTKKTMRLADERRGIERTKADLEAERTAVALDRQRYAEQLEGQMPALQQHSCISRTSTGADYRSKTRRSLRKRSRCSIRSPANCSKPKPSGCCSSSRSDSASFMPCRLTRITSPGRSRR